MATQDNYGEYTSIAERDPESEIAQAIARYKQQIASDQESIPQREEAELTQVAENGDVISNKPRKKKSATLSDETEQEREEALYSAYMNSGASNAREIVPQQYIQQQQSTYVQQPTAQQQNGYNYTEAPSDYPQYTAPQQSSSVAQQLANAQTAQQQQASNSLNLQGLLNGIAAAWNKGSSGGGWYGK